MGFAFGRQKLRRSFCQSASRRKKAGDWRMTQTFSVRNFERFQHYKDRSPPWIKLYNELLDDYRFAVLPDASKWHLVAIWLLASRSDNGIPADTKWIAGHIGATEQVDLTPLQERRIYRCQSGPSGGASGWRAKRYARERGRGRGRDRERGFVRSATADADVPRSRKPKARKPIPRMFEAFWRDYPIDALMSKSKAFEKWRRLAVADRAAAHGGGARLSRPLRQGHHLSPGACGTVPVAAPLRRLRRGRRGIGARSMMRPARRMGRQGGLRWSMPSGRRNSPPGFPARLVRARPADGAEGGQVFRGGLDSRPLRRRSEAALRGISN